MTSKALPPARLSFGRLPDSPIGRGTKVACCSTTRTTDDDDDDDELHPSEQPPQPSTHRLQVSRARPSCVPSPACCLQHPRGYSFLTHSGCDLAAAQARAMLVLVSPLSRASLRRSYATATGSPQTLIEKIVQKYAVGTEEGKKVRSGDYVMVGPEHVSVPPQASCVRDSRARAD
jgi:hypothetical protein